CKALQPADADDADDADDQGGGGEVGAEEEAKAILDGPPPVPPTQPDPTPPNFPLRDFDAAIGALKQLMTKPSAQFAGTIHDANDLENVADFIRAVRGARMRPLDGAQLTTTEPTRSATSGLLGTE